MTSKIVGTPYLLFLGAGASQPYGKMLMREFVQVFRTKFKATDKNPLSFAPPLLEAICGEKEDLEFLIEELEHLGSRQYLEKQSHSLSNGKEEPRWKEVRALAQSARNLLANLKREVYFHYRNIPDPSPTVESLLNSPIDLLRTAEHPSVVFTTNYDPAVEEFCSNREDLNLVDGFQYDPRRHEDVWTRDAFDHFTDDFATEPDKSLVLFKLHGSANWFRHKGRIVKSRPIYDPSDPEYRNLMIYPATRKVAIEDPFFTAYDYLEQCLDKAQGCLVIGYSFRDYDALMRLKSARLSNKHLRVVVLDPHADDICTTLGANGITAHPIPYIFGPDEQQYWGLVARAFNLSEKYLPTPR
jgi:hypothetical protein